MADADQGRATHNTLRRLTVAILVGLCVATLAILIAWKVNRNAMGITYLQWQTQHTLKDWVNHAIDTYQKDHGRPPESISDLRDGGHLIFTEAGELLDGWNRPMLASFDGSKLVVTSLGRDGKSGGVGLDHDLDNLNPIPPKASITLYQFLFESPTRPVQGWCFTIGAIAAFLTFVGSSRDVKIKQSRANRAYSFGIVFMSASLFGAFMSALQLHSGH